MTGSVWRRRVADGDASVFFLLRSLICIALVYALAMTDREPSPVGVASPRAAMAVTAVQSPERRPKLTETTKALAQAGVDALGAAARDHCLSAPQECVEMLRKLNVARER